MTAKQAGFTLVEMVVSMAASLLIIGALFLSSLSLQKALHRNEKSAGAYSDQHRLIDYLGRDLRRAVGISATDERGVRYDVGAGTVAISDRASLILSLPGYYQSNTKSDSAYGAALGVVGTEERLDYGTADGLAGTVEVSFRKEFRAREKGVCFVRQEAGVETVIVRQAENLYVQVTTTEGGQTGAIKAWSRDPGTGPLPLATTYDQLLLRNPPLHFQP